MNRILRIRMAAPLLAAALLIGVLGGCASAGPMGAANASALGGEPGSAATTAMNPADPWESFNRAVFRLNDHIDRSFLLPLAEVYRKYVPAPVIQGFGNVLANASDVWSAANHLLQGKPQAALETGMRVGVNTLFGLGGLLDVASEMGLERRSEDFGQTLGVWGFGSGPYLVLPLLGPSSLRDGLALPVDRSTGLTTLAGMSATHTAVVTFAETVHIRAALLGASSLLGQVALDRYSFLRDSYLARRRNAVYDGNPPPDPEDEEPKAKGEVAKPQ